MIVVGSHESMAGSRCAGLESATRLPAASDRAVRYHCRATGTLIGTITGCFELALAGLRLLLPPLSVAPTVENTEGRALGHDEVERLRELATSSSVGDEAGAAALRRRDEAVLLQGSRSTGGEGTEAGGGTELPPSAPISWAAPIQKSGSAGDLMATMA